MREFAEFVEASMELSYKERSECCVNNFGFEQCSKGYQYGPRVCPYHLIHFVLSGEGELHIAGQELTVRAGDAFLIPAEKIAWYRASATDPWKYAWAGFLGYRANSYFDQLMEASEERYVLRDLDTDPYEKLIRRGAVISDGGYSGYFHANAILMELLGQLYEEVGGRVKDNQHTMADEIRYHLEMRYSEKLRLTDLAGMLGIHPNYLTRVFREKYQMTPKQYLMQLKLEKACQLLVETDYPVSFISDTLGFEDQMSFSKTFRSRYNMTPTQYRGSAHP